MQQIGFLFETFSPVANSDIVILEDAHVNGNKKAVFKVRLQTVEERNGNGRYYDRGIGKEIVETLASKAKGRSLFQEVDHPMVAVDPSDPAGAAFARKRAVTVELKNCGSLIRDIRMEGNDIIGEVETLSGFMGPDLYKTLMYDKADIGFSLRMFGKVNLDESTGLAHVARPIRPITYDTVSNPSHRTAKVIEVMTENLNDFMPDEHQNTELLHESSCLMCDGVNFCSDENCIKDFIGQLVEETFHTVGTVQFRL